MQETPPSSTVDPVGDLQVAVTAVLAERGFSVDQILQLRPGVLMDFGRSHRGALDLLVNGSRVARGRAVDVGDRLGFLVEALDPRPGGERTSGDCGAQRS